MAEMFADSNAVMQRALELAASGLGRVEPNPPVGAVLVDDHLRLIACGYHESFGGPHAEVNALDQAATRARGSTLYVTLEPCCHQGKTGPCTRAIIEAGVRKVVIGVTDPAPYVDGGGIAALRDAGIEVEVGVLEPACRRLAAPYIKRVTTGLPYVHAKWAMTLDGKTAARTGHSRWISNEGSRAIAHRLRGRMDAVVIGYGTAAEDDPLLTARPAGPRVATRIVVDSMARLSLRSRLVRTLHEAPVIVVAADSAPPQNVAELRTAGVEVLQLPAVQVSSGLPSRPDLESMLRELGRRQMTNIILEGGGRLSGALFDAGLIDEVHVFIAAKLVGGAEASSPLEGRGLGEIPAASQIEDLAIEIVDGDVYVHGPLSKTGS